MPNFLLEIGCEEIPARFVADLAEALKTKLAAALVDAKILGDAAATKSYATYRRLTVEIPGLLVRQPDQVEALMGPPLDVAKKGNDWQPAAIAFAKKAGISVEALATTKDAKGRDVLFAKREILGRPTTDVLADLIPSIVKGLSLPIAMTWGYAEFTFIRPVHWVVALLGNVIVPVTLFDVSASNFTFGHRFLSEGEAGVDSIDGPKIVLKSADDYVAALKSKWVLVDPNARRDIIKESVLTTSLNSTAGAANLLQLDETLLEEVVYLTECPVMLRGQFDKRYLELPDGVVVQCMKKHQKYFPIYDENGLTNTFWLAAENVTDKSRETIIAGNERVLKARLEDVRYFWDEDRKKKLEDFLPKLKTVMFQKGLGTMWDKKERIKRLANAISGQVPGFPDSKTEHLERIAELCKADLASQMVYEMPTLQGVMGEEYARLSGESPQVAKGIFQHYLPRFEKDEIPSVSAFEPGIDPRLGAIVGIADRLDTIVACFENGMIPTGSKDPWAVRRALLGVVRLVLEVGINSQQPDLAGINLEKILDKAYELLQKSGENRGKLDDFFLQRIRQFFLDAGYAHDLVDAVLPQALSNLVVTRDRLEQLQVFRSKNVPTFKALVEAAVRVGNLAAKADDSAVNPALFKDDAEKNLWQQLNDAKTKFSLAALAEQLPLLATLSEPLSAYFEKVLVMDNDDNLRKNRLATLREAHQLFRQFADFAKIVA